MAPLRAQRFHSLTGDGRMRLLVLAPVEGCCAVSAEAAQRAARTRNCRAAYHSLAEAVQGSRCGPSGPFPTSLPLLNS